MFLCASRFRPPQLVAPTTLSTPAGAQLGECLLEEADGAGRRHEGPKRAWRFVCVRAIG